MCIRLTILSFHSLCSGAIFAGGVSAGVYTTNSPDACRHIAKDCRAQILVVENQQCFDKFQDMKQHLPLVKVSCRQIYPIPVSCGPPPGLPVSSRDGVP